MLVNIINYTVKILIVVLGILILSGIILEQADPRLRIMMGVVFILFGIYRLVQYRGKRKHYYTSDDD